MIARTQQGPWLGRLPSDKECGRGAWFFDVYESSVKQPSIILVARSSIALDEQHPVMPSDEECAAEFAELHKFMDKANQ